MREAPLQKVVLGLGFTTDGGPRATVEHTHNRIPGIGWRAVSKLQFERKNPYAQTEWTAIPDPKGWRWSTLARVEKLDDDRLWVVADRTVTPYDGDLDDYQRAVLSTRSERDNSERRTATEKSQRDKPGKRAPLKQKIAKAEAEIERITDIIAKIDVALALPDLFQRDPKQAAQLSKARASAADALQRAENEWLEASTSLEETSG